MRKLLASASIGAMAVLLSAGAYAQEGTVAKAVGGYSFEDAAKENPGTKDFHSADGHLTFAIVTHTAGNGFFDPVYVGATVAGNMIGAKILLLGSESPTDDPQREIEILNQIVAGPDHRRPDHDDAAGRRLQRHRQGGGEERHPGRHHQLVRRQHHQPQRHQPHRPGCLGRRDRRRGPGQVRAGKGVDKGSIILPSSTAMGNVEVNNRVTAAFNAIVKTLKDAGKLENFKVDAGPENVGVDANPQDPVNSIVSLFESRGDVVGAFTANNVFTPALAKAVAQMGKTGKICAYGFDLGPAQQDAIRSRRSDRLARSAALPAGLLAGHAALSPDRPRHLGGQSGHPGAVGDQGPRRQGRQALRELNPPQSRRTAYRGRDHSLPRSCYPCHLHGSVEGRCLTACKCEWAACPPSWSAAGSSACSS